VPRSSGDIVTLGVCSGFTAVGMGGDDILTQNSTGEFEVLDDVVFNP
jgi:hypothetical protein